jgi:hypothetical protein
MGVCMRMKHRWTGALLLAAALALGACAPTDAGADDESASPTTEASQEPSMAPESAAPSPTEGGVDEY